MVGSVVGMPASLIGAFAVPRLWKTRYWFVPWVLCATCSCWAQMAISATMDETLPPAKRKPFVGLRRANPLANVALLFRNGVGLRNLSLSTALFFLAQSNRSVETSYQMHGLGWTPGDSSCASKRAFRSLLQSVLFG